MCNISLQQLNSKRLFANSPLRCLNFLFSQINLYALTLVCIFSMHTVLDIFLKVLTWRFRVTIKELLQLVIISPVLVTLKGTCIFKANTTKKTLNISTQDIWYLKSYLYPCYCFFAAFKTGLYGKFELPAFAILLGCAMRFGLMTCNGCSVLSSLGLSWGVPWQNG